MQNKEKMDGLRGPARPVVALVDDDPEILRSLGRLLRREPYELLSTESPHQMLEWAQERPIDLVITDQRMPEMSGTELLGLLWNRAPGIRGVILSGFPDTALVVEQSGIRIERLIAKPWANSFLKSTIRELLEKPALEGANAPFEVRIDCAGKSSGLVLGDLIPACRRAPSGAPRVRITFDNLLLLQDSLARLLKDLARITAFLDTSIELRDSSGCVNAFLEAVSERAKMSSP
jgi:response regulator RpfG family c-di-GMP phosphodiesterase